MLKMEQVRHLQVPGWENFTPPDGKHAECSCELTNGYISNNNGNSINKIVNNNNNNNNSCSNIALTTNGRCCGDINTMNANDKYTAAIELSNKCREFYNSRLQAANSIKSKWRLAPSDKLSTENSFSSSPLPKLSCQISGSSSSSSSSSSSCSESLTPSSSTSSLSTCSTSVAKEDDNKTPNSDSRKTRRHNSIDQAMDRLRTEMVSLMEQDLSLMKQLLTLNETIEELKWQRQYYSCSISCTSLSPSGHFQYRAGEGGSAWSVSDTEMYESEDDFRLLAAGSDNLAATSTPAATPLAAQTTASSSGTVTPVSSSSVSLAMAQQHIQPPSKGHVTGSTWHSTRKARKASREADLISLDSLSFRNGLGDEGEGGLAAEVQAALRQMESSAVKNGDSSIFPIAFVDNYRNRPADQNTQGDGKPKKATVSYKVTPASPGSSGKSFKFTNDHLNLTPGPIIRHDRDQHSFDSGIHEPALSEEIVWNV